MNDDETPAFLYEDYRANKIRNGLLYQDFIVSLCWQTIGLAIAQHASREFQMQVGESRTGAEIKFDELSITSESLWIEVAEKSRPRDGDYMPSGIFRSDNTWLYIIGNYDTVFVFAKKTLQLLHNCGRYDVLENRFKTARGFKLPIDQARKYAAIIIEPRASRAVNEFIRDPFSAGRKMAELVRSIR